MHGQPSMFVQELVWLHHAGKYAVLLHERYLRHHVLVLRDGRPLLYLQCSGKHHDDHRQRVLPWRLCAGRPVPVYHPVAHPVAPF